MLRFRIHHIMMLIAAAALFFAVARDDIPCTPLAPFLLGAYICGGLSAWGARVRGRRRAIRTDGRVIARATRGDLGVVESDSGEVLGPEERHRTTREWWEPLADSHLEEEQAWLSHADTLKTNPIPRNTSQ